MAVNYTPGQLRDAVGIGQETYRHWKKALAPLRRDAGHSPCFTAGDLLAAAIVKTFVANYGMRVSALSALAGGRHCHVWMSPADQGLFRRCADRGCGHVFDLSRGE